MPSIRGTASVTDARAMSKALKGTKFPSSFSKRVNLSKINRNVLLEWIESKITSVLGFDDEIVTSTAGNLFLPSDEIAMTEVDPRRAQIDMAGFLGEEPAAQFAKELWELLLDAQDSPHGIPHKLMEEKKKELAQAKAAQAQQKQGGRGGHYNNGEPIVRYGQDTNQYPDRGRQGGGNRVGGAYDRWKNDHHQDRHNPHYRGPPARYPPRGGGGDRGPAPYRGPPFPHHRDRDHPRHPVPVSPPHPSEEEDRKMPYQPPHRGRGPAPEDEFGRALLSRREGPRNSSREEYEQAGGSRREDRGHPPPRGARSSPRARREERPPAVEGAQRPASDDHSNTSCSPSEDSYEHRRSSSSRKRRHKERHHRSHRDRRHIDDDDDGDYDRRKRNRRHKHDRDDSDPERDQRRGSGDRKRHRRSRSRERRSHKRDRAPNHSSGSEGSE